MGAAKPLKVTWAPASVGITLPLLSKFGPQFGGIHTVPSLKLKPKMAAMEPGARDEEVRLKLAVFKIPPGLIVGWEELPPLLLSVIPPPEVTLPVTAPADEKP